MSNLEALARNLEVIAENTSKVYNAGFEKGKEQGGGTNSTMYAAELRFTSDAWATSDTVILNVPNLRTMSSICNSADFKIIKHLTINSNTPITTAVNAFRCSSNSTLETLVLNIDTTKCTSYDTFFFKANNIKRIEGNPLDFSSAGASSLARYSYKLEYFRVVPNTISKSLDLGHNSALDEGTIKSVIEV